MIMVKPALPISTSSPRPPAFRLPIAAYQVSGEYSYDRRRRPQRWIDYDRAMMKL